MDITLKAPNVLVTSKGRKTSKRRAMAGKKSVMRRRLTVIRPLPSMTHTLATLHFRLPAKHSWLRHVITAAGHQYASTEASRH